MTLNLADETRRAAAERWTGLLRIDTPYPAQLAFVDGDLVEAAAGSEHGLPALRTALVLLATAIPERSPLGATASSDSVISREQILQEVSRCSRERMGLGTVASFTAVPIPVEGTDVMATDAVSPDVRLEPARFDRLAETLLAIDGRSSMDVIIGERPALTVVHEVADLARYGLVSIGPETEEALTVVSPPQEPRSVRVKRLALVGGALLLSLGCTSIAMRMTQLDVPMRLGANASARQLVELSSAPVALLRQPDVLLARVERPDPQPAELTLPPDPGVDDETASDAQDQTAGATQVEATVVDPTPISSDVAPEVSAEPIPPVTVAKAALTQSTKETASLELSTASSAPVSTAIPARDDAADTEDTTQATVPDETPSADAPMPNETGDDTLDEVPDAAEDALPVAPVTPTDVVRQPKRDSHSAGPASLVQPPQSGRARLPEALDPEPVTATAQAEAQASIDKPSNSPTARDDSSAAKPEKSNAESSPSTPEKPAAPQSNPNKPGDSAAQNSGSKPDSSTQNKTGNAGNGGNANGGGNANSGGNGNGGGKSGGDHGSSGGKNAGTRAP